MRGYVPMADYMRVVGELERLREQLGADEAPRPRPSREPLVFGRITVDFDNERVLVDGAYVRLTGREYDLMARLAARPGVTVTKEALMDHLYGGRDEPHLKIVDVFVCKVRRKLHNASAQVETVWGRGYRLVETPQASLRDPDPISVGQQYEVCAAIRDQELSFWQINDALPRQPSTIRNLIGRMIRLRLVRNIGSWAAARYVLTEEGKAWLAEYELGRAA